MQFRMGACFLGKLNLFEMPMGAVGYPSSVDLIEYSYYWELHCQQVTRGAVCDIPLLLLISAVLSFYFKTAKKLITCSFPTF